MNLRSLAIGFASTLIFLARVCSFAQNPGTGNYPYSHPDSFGFDSINPGNLNIHFEIPIVSKPGRGRPFQYSLEFDGLVWSPSSADGSNAWTPDPSFGIHGHLLNDGYKGYLSYSSISRKCFDDPDNPGRWDWLPVVSNYVYHDEFGVDHPFNYYQNFCTNVYTGDGSTSDGSGFRVDPNSNNVYSSSGLSMHLPIYMNGSPYALDAIIQDSNGNMVTNNQNGTFTDTMNYTPLSISGIGTPGSPRTLTYSTVGGGTAAITIYYTTIGVSTAFNCYAVTEFGSQSINLPSSISLADGTSYQFGYDGAGRITSVALPTGGTISYTYNGGVNCADGTPMQLSRMTSVSSDGTTQYVRSNISATHNHTEITGPHGDQTEIDFVYSAGTPYETTRSVYSGGSSGGMLLAKTDTCYNGYAPPNCTAQPLSLPVNQLSVFRTIGSKESGSDTFYNSNSLVTDVKEYDYGSGGRGSLLRETAYGYAVLGQYVTDKVSSVQQYDAAHSLYAKTTYGYDESSPRGTSNLPQHLATSGPRGNLTSVHSWVNGTNSIDTYYAVDDAGQIVTVSGTNPGTTTYSYDSATDALLSSVAPPMLNGVALGSSYTYDPYTGLLVSAADANGQPTGYQYDSLLRSTRTDRADHGWTTNSYTAAQSGIPMRTSTNVSKSPSPMNTETQYDPFGRQTRAAIANEQGAWYQTDICLNPAALTSFTSYKYQGSGVNSGAVCSGNGGDLTSYDPLGRVTHVTHGDGSSVTYNYGGRATAVTDENNVNRITQVDGLGRITAVCEVTSVTLAGDNPSGCGLDLAGTGFLTTYTYNDASHTTTVNQGGQTRIFQTDWAGRPIYTYEPESGVTTYFYSYNSTGLEVDRYRPQANQSDPGTKTRTTTQYDALGRTVSISYDDGTPTKDFLYDAGASQIFSNFTQANLAGRLSMAYTSSAATAYSYDAVGRVTALDECLSSECGNVNNHHLLQYGYDLAGNLISSTDGAGVTSTYSVSVAGEVQSITSSRNDTPNLLSNATYCPYGPVSYDLGNSMSGMFEYDAQGRVKTGGVKRSGSNIPGVCYVQGYGYKFSASWRGERLMSSADSAANQALTYGYDEFNRLTSTTLAAGTGPTFSWSYDRYGNRLSQTVTSGSGLSPSLTYNPATNHITSYVYDAAGNVTNNGFHTYTYDADGNVTAVDGGAAQYVYNALNQRVQAATIGGVRNFVFNQSGQRASEWDGNTHAPLKGHYYWGSRPLAYYDTTTTHFEYQDWQGTERMRASSSGAPEGKFASTPFGDSQSTLSGADTDAYHYAGLDYDSETSTDHAQFRQYSPVQGNWLSPDPYAGSYDFSNPQSLNRYAYVLNNPVALNDPSGLEETSGCNPIESCGGGNGLGDPGYYSDQFGNSYYWDGSTLTQYNPESVQVYADNDGWETCGGDCSISTPNTIGELSTTDMASAPNNGPQNPRSTLCKFKVGAGIALDTAGTVAGLFPGAGAALVTTQVSLGLASSAYSAYNKNVGFTIGNATGAQVSAVRALAVGTETVGWQTAAETLPWVGTAYNAFALGWDVWHANRDYQACLAGN
jgi:RHS repeat-associated protein